MDASRSRRNASRRDTARAALEDFVKGRNAGGNRVMEMQLEKEENIYDAVDEDEYAQIVQQRRNEALDFIVDDDGQGVYDLGDDDDMFYGEENGGADGEAAEAGKKRGRGKKADKDAANANKDAATDRIKLMFKTGVKKGKNQAGVDEQHADALLDAMLDEVPKPTVAQAPMARRPGLMGVARMPAGASMRPHVPAMAPLSTAHLLSAVSAPRLLKTVDEHAYDNAGMGGDWDEPAAHVTMTTEAKEEHIEVPKVDAAAQPPVKRARFAEPEVAPTTASAQEEEEAKMSTGWASILAGDKEGANAPAPEAVRLAADASLPLTPDGLLPFFLLDASEDFSSPGTVHLFGKVPIGPRQFVSCCVSVKGMYRSLFVVPKPEIFADPEGDLKSLELQATEDAECRLDLIRELNERAMPVKKELYNLLDSHGISKYGMLPVKRNYAFEDDRVPHGTNYVLKIKYNVLHPETNKAQGQLPLGLCGENFTAVLGTNQSLLELLLLKRKINGPSWLYLKSAQRVHEDSKLISHCKLEVILASPKDVVTSTVAQQEAAAAKRPFTPLPTPTLTVAALHVKTHMDAAAKANEIVSASVVYLQDVVPDAPLAKNDWNDASRVKYICTVSKLEGKPYPPGFEAAAPKAAVVHQGSERALLSYLMTRMKSIDADVLVGHNIGGYDLDVLLHRMQVHKVPNWSMIGRLKRSKFPSLTGGGSVYGGGASQGVMSCIAGRLLCDTYLMAREFVHEVDYTLTTLTRELLGEHRSEVAPSDIPRRYQSLEDLIQFAQQTSQDAYLSLALSFHLSVLPLTLQLTRLSGSLWNRTLASQRAQRIEMLLLHKFYSLKYLLPDKLTMSEKNKLAKELAANAAHANKEEAIEGVVEEADIADASMEEVGMQVGSVGEEEPAAATGRGGRRKKAAYLGGLVFEPRKGLYNNYVIMLDFNSLYPSIIQEFNICFTTIDRPKDGSAPGLPAAPLDFDHLAPLPTVIRQLVLERRKVKDQIKRETDPVRRQQLDIRQQALKLTANSMYGCLGFSNSRFYAQPLAELITLQGRNILQSTKDMVEKTLGLEVIYGDTDSIFINTRLTDIGKAREKGAELKKTLNKRYRLLEMELDAIFKCILLLKKKKYAAIKVEVDAAGRDTMHMEQKGLDIVRRDWCPLAKECGNFALERILSGDDTDKVVADIHEFLEERGKWLKALTWGEDLKRSLHRFLIFKQLTKRPDEYPDAKNQPHVQVALRRRAQGKRDCINAGDTVPYIICAVYGADGAIVTGESKGLADRAYHIEEVRNSEGKLRPDLDYYLGQQVHPVVSRLCLHLDGTDASRLAASLGMDASRFKQQSFANRQEDSFSVYQDEGAEYDACPKLMLKSAEGGEFPFAGVVEILKNKDAKPESFLTPPRASSEEVGGSNEAEPLHPASLANQVRLYIRSLFREFYNGELSHEEDPELQSVRQISLRKHEGELGTALVFPDRATRGKMHRVMTKSDLHKRLRHLRFLFSYREYVHGTGVNKRTLERRIEPIRHQLDMALHEVYQALRSSEFNFVRLDRLFGARKVNASF